MQKVSVSGPAELVTIIPFVLGFRPERSIVVVGLRDRRVELVARLDTLDEPAASQAAEQIGTVLARERLTGLAVIGFEDAPGESGVLAEAIVVVAGQSGIPVPIDLVVRDGRWWCRNACACAHESPDECPVEGQPLPWPAEVPAVADYVANGRAVLRARSDLEALVTPGAEASDHALVEEIRQWRLAYLAARAACFLERLDEADLEARIAGKADVGDSSGSSGHALHRPPRLSSGSRWDELTDESLAAWASLVDGRLTGSDLRAALPALVGPLEDRDLRDVLIAWLSPGWLPQGVVDDRLLERLDHHVRVAGGRLTAARSSGAGTDPGGRHGAFAALPTTTAPQEALDVLGRSTPVEFAPPVLTIAAAHAWWRGDGARAGICVDAALALDPGHTLAQLIGAALKHGMRPQRRDGRGPDSPEVHTVDEESGITRRVS